MPSAKSDDLTAKTGDAQGEHHHEPLVSDRISDAVSMANVMTIGVGPAYAALQSMLSQSQAQSILMANMVSSQKQNSINGMTTMTKSIEHMMKRHNR